MPGSDVVVRRSHRTPEASRMLVPGRRPLDGRGRGHRAGAAIRRAARGSDGSAADSAGRRSLNSSSSSDTSSSSAIA